MLRMVMFLTFPRDVSEESGKPLSRSEGVLLKRGSHLVRGRSPRSRRRNNRMLEGRSEFSRLSRREFEPPLFHRVEVRCAPVCFHDPFAILRRAQQEMAHFMRDHAREDVPLRILRVLLQFGKNVG